MYSYEIKMNDECLMSLKKNINYYPSVIAHYLLLIAHYSFLKAFPFYKHVFISKLSDYQA